jgi:hypothetical protein
VFVAGEGRFEMEMVMDGEGRDVWRDIKKMVIVGY